MSMGGERHVEVEYQSGRSVLLYIENIYAMNKDSLYSNIFQRGIKSKNSTDKKSLKDRLKVDI